ncbi:MAG: biotin transporter BioY [Lachnospiraceae bacterium]|nr:biotin transporter BioY [Lachnospiraceae bacterium]
MTEATITKKKESTAKLNTKTITVIGVMTAIICIMGPMSLTLPVSPVPISLGTLAIYFIPYVLGMKKGTISCCVYLLIGLVGLPVFTGFSSGPAKLLGPTGGYLIGYIFMTLICGVVIDRTNKVPVCFLGMVLATAVLYLFGTVWLTYQASMTFREALMAGVIPFIPGDLAKMVIAMLVGPQIKKRLKKAGLV